MLTFDRRCSTCRYIYDLYYKREAISKELYDWLLKQEYADAKSVSPLPFTHPGRGNSLGARIHETEIGC